MMSTSPTTYGFSESKILKRVQSWRACMELVLFGKESQCSSSSGEETWKKNKSSRCFSFCPYSRVGSFAVENMS